jgi:predicted TIM-barrel fold metal-dependent hydrolase
VIVDANAHASLTGEWFGTGHDASLSRLLAAMDDAGVDRAVLTGLIDVAPTAAVVELAAHAAGRLLPVGAFDPGEHATPDAVREAARAELRGRGLVGVKLHPRLGRYDLLDPRALALMDELESWDDRLGVWICTFLHVPGIRAAAGPVEALVEVVGRYPGLRFVLVHGGGPDLLRLATAVRGSHNALLDLSYTLTHLAGSSVGTDITHLLTTFERRLVFGSDFPEGDVGAARAALEGLASGAGPDALARVLGGNMGEMLDGAL